MCFSYTRSVPATPSNKTATSKTATPSYIQLQATPQLSFFCENQLQATTAGWHTSPGRGQMLVAGHGWGGLTQNTTSADLLFAATASYMPAPGGGTCSWGSPQPLWWGLAEATAAPKGIVRAEHIAFTRDGQASLERSSIQIIQPCDWRPHQPPLHPTTTESSVTSKSTWAYAWVLVGHCMCRSALSVHVQIAQQ